MIVMSTVRNVARLVACCLFLCCTWPVQGGQVSANVEVRVKLISSSGTCGAGVSGNGVGVICRNVPSGGPLLPMVGAVPFQRVGAIQLQGFELPGVAAEPLPLYSDGVKITSWRIVTLDNAKYVELTIAW